MTFQQTKKTNSAFHSTRPVLGTAMSLLGAVALAACSGGSDDEDHSAVGGASASPATPVSMVVSDLVLTAADAPTGFEHSNVADLFTQEGAEDTLAVIKDLNDSTTVDPETCRGLAASGVATVATVYEHPESIAVAEFATDDTVIDALVSTVDSGERLPADLTGCAEFTTGNNDDRTESHYTLKSAVSDARIRDAVNSRVITVTAGEATPESWQPANFVDGYVGPVYFRVSGHGSIDPQMLIGVAQQQVDRITGR